MGFHKDKLVILLRDHYGSQGQAARDLGLSEMTMSRLILKRDQRRNLLKYLPELHEHTKVSVQELYDVIINR